ncbi:MAG: ABC transporter permease [Lachnospiraceae bacterium]|jgi:ABC-2 type transport system permease protein|nr:ABC transporter permease [Lachnospiraceae bacterium]MCI1328787.1 ABC transporter permease [Lachnospiraceae bacterium]
MNNLGVVFRFEFMNQTRKKAFRVTAVIIAAVIVFLVLAPALFRSAFEGGDDGLDGGVVFEDQAYADLLPFDEDHIYGTAEELEDAVKSGKEDIGYVILDPTHIRTIYSNYGVSDEAKSAAVVGAMKEIYIRQALAQQGVSDEAYQKIQNQEIHNETVIYGKDTTAQYASAMVFVILVYMVILVYGQVVAAAIAREKDSKTMELLITTTRADSLILGKVFAVIAVVLIALAVYLTAAAVPYLLVKDRYPEAVKEALNSSLNPSMIGIYILFFFIGLVMYLFILAALGSVVSRVEEVSSSLSPVVTMMVVSYALSFVLMTGVDNAVLDGLSWIPFFSVLMMPIRYAYGGIALSGVFVSAAVCVAFTVFLAHVSIRIYRWGTLNYGNKPSLTGVLRQVFGKSGKGAAV